MTEKIAVRSGSVEQALDNGRKLLTEHPDAALTQARTLLKLGPDPRVLRLAAAAHRKLGQAAEAEAAELAAIQQSLPIPRLKAAAQAEYEGRSGEASALAAEHLLHEPDDLLAMTISAEAAISLRRLPEGEALLRAVLERAPPFLRASMMLGRCLTLQCRMADAISVMEQAVTRAPHSVPARKLLAQFRAEAGDFAGAAATYERILAQHDREADLWVSYGDMLRFLGRRTDGALAYRRGLLVDQASGLPWWGLADLDPGAITDKDITRMEAALEERANKPEDSGPLHFALGAVLDKRGQYTEAFKHFVEGNRLRQVAQPYDPSTLTDETVRSIELFTRNFYASRASDAAADDSPIFIIGMPRSGSTLVERIVGRHSQVEGTGELPVIPRIVESLSMRGGGIGKYREILAELPAPQLRDLGELYLRGAQEFRKSNKCWFTDKLHMNWRHVGFIHLILPKAKIIDVRRGAMDCCWSNYKLLFTRGHPAASSLQHIGRFYADYVRMMDHMSAVAPEAVLRVRYEDVVENIQGETRRILDFIGTPFEEECLEFHLSSDPVATASSEQVRRPLNREGIGSAVPYAKWLDPLRDALGPLADA